MPWLISLQRGWSKYFVKQHRKISQFDVFISEDRWNNKTTLCQQETNCNHTIQSEVNNLDNPNEKVKMTEAIIPQREQL